MTIAMNVEKEHGQHAVNLSLLKVGPIVQATLAAIITVIVLLATATTVTVVVSRSSYQPPIPADDSAVTYKTTPVNIYVLSNDKDPRKENLTVGGIVNQPLFGKAEVVDNRYIRYTPAVRYAGEVEFEYICKNSKEQATAKVYVTIENHPPEPVDFYFRGEDDGIKKNSEGNPRKIFEIEDKNTGKKIIDLDGDPLRIVNITAPKNGTAWFDDDTLYYTPNKEFNGIDSFTYTITDDNDTATATVTYEVTNTAPVANPDYYIVTMNKIHKLEILANDYDVNGDELFIHGELGLSPTGKISFTISDDRKYVICRPSIGLHGKHESFEYTITDGWLTGTSFALVTVVNTPPEAGEYAVEVKKNTEDNPIPIRYSDEDPGSTLTVKIVREPSRGTYNFTYVTKKLDFEIDEEWYPYDWHEYSLTYTPDYGDIYEDYMEYEVTDNTGATAIGKITIKVTNTPPVAVDDVIEDDPCQKNGRIEIRVLENDYDPNGDEIFLYSADTNSKYGGTIRENKAEGTIRYIAPNNFVGVDEFTYTIKDIHDVISKPATVYVKVVNTAPTAVDDVFSCSKGHTCKFDVLSNDFDINSDKLSITNFTEPLYGGFAQHTTIPDSQNRPKDAIEYQTQNTVYTDYMTYTITDGELEDTANVEINIYNEKPIPVDDHATTHWNNSVEINVVENDMDNNPGDKEKLVVANIIDHPQNGEVGFEGGVVIYIPDPGYIGTDSFTYTVRDEFDVSETTATVTVEVTNNAPVAMPDEYIMHWRDSSLLDVTENDYDPDNDEFYLKDVSYSYETGSAVIENGKISFKPPTTKGLISFNYVISDYSQFVGVGTVKVFLENSEPEALNDEISRHWRDFRDGVIINVMDNDRDADLDPITIKSVDTEGTQGSVALEDAAAGAVKYNFTEVFTTASVVDSFKYTITDQVDEDTATVTITITNNDRPTAQDTHRKIHWRTQETGTLVEVVGSLRDNDNDDLTVTIVGAPQHGVAIVEQLNGKQYIKYTQNNGYKGIDSVTYSVSDGLASAQATITFEIYNSIPTAEDFAYDLPYEERDIGIAVDVIRSAHDEDPEDRSYLSIKHVGTPAKGTITSGLNNPIVYTAPDGWMGDDTFTYTVTDGLDEVTKSITINTLPQIQGNHTKRYTIHWSTQNSGSTFDVMEGIVDQTGTKFEVQRVIKPPTFGQLQLVDKHEVFYKQNAGFLGNERFEVEYSDVQGVHTEVLPVTVVVYNNEPTATLAPVNMHWRETKEINLLATASDADPEDTVTVKSVGSSNGKFTNPSGDKKTYKYDPDSFVGTDLIQIGYTDGLATITRQLQVTVNNAVPKPAKISLNKHWREHKAVFSINVLAGCTDDDALDKCQLSSIGSLVPEVAGTVTIQNQADGTVQMKASPNQNFRNNKATFMYTVTDGLATASNQVEVTITNAIPTGTADSYTIDYENNKNGIALNVLANDNDADPQDKDHLTITTVTSPVSGATVTVAADSKTIKYTPLPAFLGTDTFYYTITDGMDISAQIAVTVKVQSPEPTAVNHVREMKWNADPVDIDLLRGATGLGLKYASRTAASKGTVTDVVPSQPDGKVTYKPFNSPTIYDSTVDGHRVAVEKFQYKVRDQFNREKTADVTITIKNRIPKCKPRDDTFAKSKSNPERTYSVIADNCTDDEPLIISEIQRPSSQSIIQLSSDSKKIIYKPAPGWSGTEVIKYKAKDGQLESEWTSLTITVTNNPPVCSDITQNVVKGSSLSLNVLSKCTDPNGDTLTVKLSNPDTTKGNVVLSGNTIVWTHKPRRSGQHEFNFQVTDGTATVTRKVIINIQNRKPTANDVTKSYQKMKDVTHTISIASLASDPDANDILRFTSVTGSCTIGAYQVNNNAITFSPFNGASGSCELLYTVGDSDLDGELTATGTLTLDVEDKNPIARDDFFSVKQGESKRIKISEILANDEDPDPADEIEFVDLDWNSCSKSGYCHVRPRLAGSGSNREIIWDSDPFHCSTDKIDYIIRTKGSTTKTAKATIHLSFTHCTCYAPIDLVFALDGSGSISSTNWKNLVQFVKDMVNLHLVVDSQRVRVGVIQFASNARTEFSLNYNKENVLSYIHSLKQMTGNTNTPAGLEQAQKVLKGTNSRSNAAKVIVLITDGVSNRPHNCDECAKLHGSASACTFGGETCSSCSSHKYKEPCSNPLRVSNGINARQGWKIVALGIGSSLNSDNGYGKKMVKQVDYAKKERLVDWGQLSTIANEIIDSACDQNM